MMGDVSAPDTLAGTTRNIEVGTVTEDGAIFIKYYATNGTFGQGGEITIINHGATLGWKRVWAGEAFGLVFSTSIVEGKILLSLTTDIGEGTVSFKYQKNTIEK
jgi:hypothetical protein